MVSRIMPVVIGAILAVALGVSAAHAVLKSSTVAFSAPGGGAYGGITLDIVDVTDPKNPKTVTANQETDDDGRIAGIMLDDDRSYAAQARNDTDGKPVGALIPLGSRDASGTYRVTVPGATASLIDRQGNVLFGDSPHRGVYSVYAAFGLPIGGDLHGKATQNTGSLSTLGTEHDGGDPMLKIGARVYPGAMNGNGANVLANVFFGGNVMVPLGQPNRFRGTLDSGAQESFLMGVRYNLGGSAYVGYNFAQWGPWAIAGLGGLQVMRVDVNANHAQPGVDATSGSGSSTIVNPQFGFEMKAAVGTANFILGCMFGFGPGSTITAINQQDGFGNEVTASVTIDPESNCMFAFEKAFGGF